MEQKELFLKIFRAAEKRFGKEDKRLAGEGWEHDWQMVVATIMSAQSRDETTIPIAESLFSKYKSLKSLSNAKYSDVVSVLKSLNYNKTKSKHIIECAKMLLINYKGRVPDEIDELVKLPGVGRKTANLVVSEIHDKEGICVDTHVHRICNVLGIVNTKSPNETEFALRDLIPKKYWSRINRLFVLWGKKVPGRDKERLLKEVGL